MRRVLFVCLGNICRSPMAQGVMERYVQERGLSDRIGCDSAGTGSWHTGEPPDHRTRKTLRGHGIALEHRARTLLPADFERFDLILAMDRDILREVLRRAPAGARQKVKLYRDFDPEGAGDVDDPYYGDMGDFEEVFRICERTTPAIAHWLTAPGG